MVTHRLLFSIKKVLLSILILVSFVLPPLVPTPLSAATDAELIAWIQELILIVEQLQKQIASGVALSGQPYTSPVFIDPVNYGSTNDSIRLLQEVLATDPAIYPDGSVTGYFGDLTEAALARFQATFSLTDTGTFTSETGTILTNTLTALPLTLYPETYLTVTVVRDRIALERDLFRLSDQVESGRVVLSAVPQLSVSQKSQDVATMQRILATDSQIYPERAVTGLVDAATQRAIVKLRQRYGMAYTIPPGPVDLSRLIDAQTIDLFRKILLVNNASTVKSDLLRQSLVSPSNLINDSERVLQDVRAVRDYRANKTNVTVRYEGGASNGFIIDEVEPNSAVVDAIAAKLGRTAASVSAVIEHDSVYGDDMEHILLEVFMTNSMNLTITNADGTEEFILIGDEEVGIFIYYAYGNNIQAYEQDFNRYVEMERLGEDVDAEVAELISDVIGRPEQEIVDVLEIDIERYAYDPCSSLMPPPGCGA
jgi:peptidoglycan hydrolase-like protein with peptidoglycan-binding domain